ncbi:unnamed protein product, partial [Ectocarpus sp. 6 AP-2014]
WKGGKRRFQQRRGVPLAGADQTITLSSPLQQRPGLPRGEHPPPAGWKAGAMSDEQDEANVLRGVAHRMSQGIEIKTHKHLLRAFRNTFLGMDAVEWLITDPKNGINDLDGAIQVGQRLIEHGYIARVSRELKAQQVRQFALPDKRKSEFRGGHSLYRFDMLRISPFQLHVTVRRARGLKSMDLNGKNDPYVKLRLGTQSKETRVRMKTNDPVWDERFVFGVHSVEAQQLHVSVCDYDTFKRDDHVGSCKIGLSHLPCHSSEAAAFGEGYHRDSTGTLLGEEDSSGHSSSCFDLRGGGEKASLPMDHETRSEMGGQKQEGELLEGGGQTGNGSSSSLGGPEGKGLTFYRLLANNEKRPQKGDASATSREELGGDKSSCGEIALDIRVTSLEPKPLPVQGEAKFCLRCRIWDVYGVTSPEERNLMAINSTVVKHKAVLNLCGNRVSSGSFERNKGKEKKTSFNGSVITLDAKANMATDLIKFVVMQKVSPVEMAYKPVATVVIPLRSIPVIFPEDAAEAASENKPSPSLDKTNDQQEEEGAEGRAPPSEGTGALDGRSRRSCLRRGSLSVGGGRVRSGGNRAGSGASGDGEQRRPPATARPYHLQTLAGPMTNRTMGNGFVLMSLTLVASGNDLLGEPDERDGEDVKGPLPPPPDPLTDAILDTQLSSGYQRLRKALLWNDSKLQAALVDLLNHSEVEQSSWVDRDGEAAAQENLTGCKRRRSFMLPKSAMVAATRAECHDVVLADGPSFLAFETRTQTPGVAYGDKFTVVNQYVLTKEGPEACRLQSSSQTDFSDKIMGFVHNQIVAAVAKVSKENHGHLQSLIEDAISGKGGSGAGRKSRRKVR